MTQDCTFSLELAQQLYASTEAFPIDFEDAQEWLGYSRKDAAKRNFEKAKFLKGIDFEVITLKSYSSKGGRPSEKIIMTLDCFERWKVTAGRQKPQRIEHVYQDRLAKELNGRKEVFTEAGVIDLLTSEEIIEIKGVKQWKAGIGQLMVYGEYYRSHRKRLHLFGDCHESFLVIVQKHCNKRRIVLSWEP